MTHTTVRKIDGAARKRRTRLSWLSLFLLSVAGVATFGFPASAAAQEPDQMKASQGAGVFRVYCGACHGAKGLGDGEIASVLDPKPANLTEIAKRNGGKFDIEMVKKNIDGRTRPKAHGNSQMPVWGDAFQVSDGGNTQEEVDERIDRLAQFLWSIQK